MRANITRLTTIAALGLGGLATGACTQLRSHQGYIIDADLVNSVQPGVDNRTSVLQTLGKPTFTSQFNQGDWYYISRDSRNLGYKKPKVKDQVTLRISFDPRGVVTGVAKGDASQTASISPYGKSTPTLGRKRSFFDELFGNIGTVGAAGLGGPGQGGGGGGRDRP